MPCRNPVRVLIFSFAVLTVLLRPYAAYRISMRPDIAADPVKVNSLLQRLVKKKDDHHTVIDDDRSATLPSKTFRLLPAVLSLFLAKAFVFLLAGSACYRKIDHAFRVCPRHKYYLSLLCIRL